VTHRKKIKILIPQTKKSGIFKNFLLKGIVQDISMIHKITCNMEVRLKTLGNQNGETVNSLILGKII
jgi:hypothetical protein